MGKDLEVIEHHIWCEQFLQWFHMGGTISMQAEVTTGAVGLILIQEVIVLFIFILKSVFLFDCFLLL